MAEIKSLRASTRLLFEMMWPIFTIYMLPPEYQLRFGCYLPIETWPLFTIYMLVPDYHVRSGYYLQLTC